MLSLPVYLRSGVYYLHTRICGKQFKRSLNTANRSEAISRAILLMEALGKLQPVNNIKRFEIDLGRGIFKSDGPEDHQRMMETLKAVQGLKTSGQAITPQETEETSQTSLKLGQLLDKFFLLKSHLKPATKLSYQNTIDEFSKFLKNPPILNILNSAVTRYQEHLAANNKNSARTIDNKIATIRAIFNFAIQQSYYFQKNPAENRALQSKKQKLAGGWAIFETKEIQNLFNSEFMKKSRLNDPDYYWTLVLAVVTGCRISEITGILNSQFKKSELGIDYIKIKDSKTNAGIREIPIPKIIMENGLRKFVENANEETGQVFKYNLRLGKGSGNAVGKKFSRHLEELKLTREKLVFHSIRKFVNNYFIENEVHIEPRCQFFGHEISMTNIESYSNKMSVDQLNERVKDSQYKILKLCGLVPTKF